MVEIINRKFTNPDHSCMEELPGEYVYYTISPQCRKGISAWTVARCDCGELWSAWPGLSGDISWRRAGLWAKLRYKHVGRDKEA